MAIKRLYDTLVGATVRVNQLFDPTRVEYGAFPFTKNGIEFTLSAEGRIILNGTATADTSALGFAKIVSSHKYYRKNLKSNPFNIFSYYPLDDESIVNATANNEYAVITIPNGTTVTNYKYGGMLVDLTTKFGSTIADYLYNLETATAGAGIAKLREWGFFNGEYIPYNAGTLESVQATAHVMRDADENIIGNYDLGTDVLRGLFKLDTNNNLYADGDTKTSDGTVTRKYGVRAYQSGDESLADAITDGINTVYKLVTPTTEQSTPFTNPQICDPDGTEEYVTSNGIPVGHETRYQL